METVLIAVAQKRTAIIQFNANSYVEMQNQQGWEKAVLYMILSLVYKMVGGVYLPKYK